MLRDLRMPDFHDHAVKVASPAQFKVRTRSCSAASCADVARLNQDQRNFRLFGPDETVSNLLQAVFEVTDRQWTSP